MQKIKTARDSIPLSSISQEGGLWNLIKTQNEAVCQLYKDTQYHCYSVRLGTCAGTLIFAFKIDPAGFVKLILKSVRFCRVALCPICQKRRTMKWQAKTFKILPHLLQKYPKYRFLLLTLTVKNPHITDLKSVLKLMHQAWTKLVKRKEFSLVQGWVRSLEVTRGADRDENDRIIRHRDDAHPHYHILLMVKPSYFTGAGYSSQKEWCRLWQDCLGVDYPVTVNIKAVKQPKNATQEEIHKVVIGAAVEVIKYTTKPADLLTDVIGNNVISKQDWLIELTTQLFNVRRIATGGVLKEYYKILEDDNEFDEKEVTNLLNLNEGVEIQSDEDSPRLTFDYSNSTQSYEMRPDE